MSPNTLGPTLGNWLGWRGSTGGSPDAARGEVGESSQKRCTCPESVCRLFLWVGCPPWFCPEFNDKYRVLCSVQGLQALVHSRQRLEESHSPELFWLEQGPQNTFIPMQPHFLWQNPAFGAELGLVSAKLSQRFRNTDFFSPPKWFPLSRNVSVFL